MTPRSAASLPEDLRQGKPVSLPAVPALAVNRAESVLLTTDGELKRIPHAQAQMLIHHQAALVCHAPYTRQRLGSDEFLAFDVLELFAFVHPARFCVPTPAGLARALGLSVPGNFEDYPFSLIESAQMLLEDLRRELRGGKKIDPLEAARVMGLQGKGWPWTPFIFEALDEVYDPEAPVITKTALNIWRNLPTWSESAPPQPRAHHPVTGEESRNRLLSILNHEKTEIRPQQMDYATRMTSIFAPFPSASSNTYEKAEEIASPHLLLAEAGTGVGKTLGYLAPASLWAEKNDGPVWISTYTKNLQRQIGQELDRLYPDPDLKNAKIAIRKGRENYLCLLNLEETVAGAALAKHPDQVIAAGLMARWAEVTNDGDLQGGDFPGWLSGLLGHKHSTALADKRGECLYSACDHYHRCFVERAVRKSKHAHIVVANHALVMIQTAMAGANGDLPQRYIFDEGHHLFEAADGAFAGHLTARETQDLRRWLRGHEGGRKSRARGLKRRVEDMIAGDSEAEAELESILYQAMNLPSPSWSRRLKDGNPEGATEKFLHLVYRQVYSRAEGRHGPYSLETQTRPLIEGLEDAALDLKDKLRALQKPMKSLSASLRKKLSEQAATLDTDTRRRLDSVSSGLARRLDNDVNSWVAMLDALLDGKTAPEFIEWMEIERIDGNAFDVGLYRHWVDPMRPFAAALKPHAHGIAITSATLRDGTGDETEDWRVARERTGADYLSPDAQLFAAPSPFDYAAQTRVYIASDVRKDDMDQVASAYRALFEASGGGGLGLFTAIQRLRAVHERIAEPLERAGLPLYAQHMDQMDTGTLVDIFREDVHACLLGTDAVRDGIDVPGESLRLLVYDRVPWARPTILHKARRAAFGGRRYDELITRLKLRQAYGRLVRRASDRGVFVMLDPMLPTRLQGAFPEGVIIEKVGLAEVVKGVAAFLKK